MAAEGLLVATGGLLVAVVAAAVVRSPETKAADFSLSFLSFHQFR